MVTEQTYSQIPEGAPVTVRVAFTEECVRRHDDRRKRCDRVVLSVIYQGTEFRRTLVTAPNLAFSMVPAINSLQCINQVRKMEATYR